MVSRNVYDELVEYFQESLSCRLVSKVMHGSGRQQRLHIIEETWPSQLSQHSLLYLSTRDLHVGSLQIEIEAFKQARPVQVFEYLQRAGHVEEVAPLFPL